MVVHKRFSYKAWFEHQFASLANSSDIFFTVSITKPEIWTESMADIVAIQYNSTASELKKLFFYTVRDCGFTCTWETCKPKDSRFVSFLQVATFTGYSSIVPN